LGIIDYDDPLLMLFVFLERFRFSGLKNAVQIDIQHPLTMLDEVGFPLKELPYIIWSLKKNPILYQNNMFIGGWAYVIKIM
jgi:hypothetical protein